ncbi:MAG TPA: excinuclease ABC subunit UvrC [bacterium]|nr:excinuclease ABC subunit UvrC [bacterium]
MDLPQKVADFPNAPGVYLMKDAQGRVVYVGKAIDLKKRVQSYLKEKDERYQVKFLMARVADIELVVTDSEKAAFLLENTLIKKHKPRYNIQLKDDKSYVSIKLSLKDRFPRLYVTRSIKKDGSLYFGPYSSAAASRETVEFIEKYFRLRSCSDTEFANRVRPCLQYQIHRCDAPCVGWIGEAEYGGLVDQVKLFLQGRKKDLVKILEGQMREQSDREEFEKAAATRDVVSSIRETLERQSVDRHTWLDQDAIGIHREGDRMTFCVLMVREGKVWESLLYHVKGQGEDEDVLASFVNQFYGEDRSLPDEILLPRFLESQGTLSQIFSEKRGEKTEVLNPQRGDRVDLLDLAHRNAEEGFQRRAKKGEEIRDILTGLQEELGLQNFPRRMECFDISNTGGRQSVGSLVSFVDGMPFKDGYRRFKIKTVEGPNDFASMKEVLRRRLSRLALEGDEGQKWEKPDLLVIDGGKGQLSMAEAALRELNITGFDLIALAKEKDHPSEQDRVYLPGRKNPVLLGRHSGLLHLLMRLRDEAHRFAIAYHRKLRGKKFLSSR